MIISFYRSFSFSIWHRHLRRAKSGFCPNLTNFPVFVLFGYTCFYVVSHGILNMDVRLHEGHSLCLNYEPFCAEIKCAVARTSKYGGRGHGIMIYCYFVFFLNQHLVTQFWDRLCWHLKKLELERFLTPATESKGSFTITWGGWLSRWLTNQICHKFLPISKLYLLDQ